MSDNMTIDDLVTQALAELGDVVRCRCHEAYKGRGRRDPDCQCDSADALDTVEKHIEALTAKLAKAVEALRYYAVEAMPWDCDDSLIARATLAEIEGEK